MPGEGGTGERNQMSQLEMSFKWSQSGNEWGLFVGLEIQKVAGRSVSMF
jgi:hypothetical protein